MTMRFTINLTDRDLGYFRQALRKSREAVRHAAAGALRAGAITAAIPPKEWGAIAPPTRQRTARLPP